MAMSMKQLFRPHTYMAYATSIRCRSQQFVALSQSKIAFLHYSTSQNTIVKLPNLLEFSPVISSKTTHHCTKSRRFSTTTRASSPHQVNDPGSIDSPLMQSMENKIKDELKAESVTVSDAYGDGRHVSIDVVSSAFEGQSAVNRQRMVYKAIWEELQNTVHAVDQMITRTPGEAAGK